MRSVPTSSKLSHHLFLRFLGALAVWLAVPISSDAKPGSSEKPYLRQVRIEELSKSILAFDIASGSDLVAAALSDLHVRVWRLKSGQLVHELSFVEPETDRRLKLDDDIEPISLHFSPDGKTLAVSFLNAIHLYNVETWNEEKSLSVAEEDKLRPDIKVTPATPELTRRTAEEAHAEKSKPTPGINQTMRELSALRDRGDGRTRILNFEFARDGASILASYCRSACYFSTWLGLQWMSPTGRDPLRLWNLSTASLTWERLYDPYGVISRVVLLPGGGRFIAVNSELGHCAVGAYDLSTGQTLWSHPFGPCLSPPNIVMLPDGQSFITNRVEESNRKNRAWRYAALYETLTGKKIADLPDADGIAAADISSDGRWLVSTIRRGTELQIWDLQARKIVIREVPNGWKKTPDRLLSLVRMSPDNRWLVVGARVGGAIAVYQWSEGQNSKP